jgi:hypothetical protein
MREWFLEGGWPMYPITVLGVLTLIGSVRYARAPGRDRLAHLIGFGVAVLLVGVLGTGLGLEHAARGTFEGPPETRHYILAGFCEAMHCLEAALCFAITSTLIATAGHRPKLPRGAAIPVEA